MHKETEKHQKSAELFEKNPFLTLFLHLYQKTTFFKVSQDEKIENFILAIKVSLDIPKEKDIFLIVVKTGKIYKENEIIGNLFKNGDFFSLKFQLHTPTKLELIEEWLKKLQI